MQRQVFSCSCNLLLQPAPATCSCNLLLQPAPATCSCNLLLQPATCSCNLHAAPATGQGEIDMRTTLTSNMRSIFPSLPTTTT